MSDLASGRYPDTYEEWLLDGKPSQPYRTTIKRSDIISGGVTITLNTVFVFPVVVQQGDLIGAISVGVKTATATGTHGWAALYSGVGTAATLLAQSADVTSGFTTSATAQKFTLATPYQVGANPGGTGVDGPVVLGVAVYNSGATAGALDGMTGSNVAGAQILSGQVSMVNTVALAATATAPATLAGIAAAVNGVPYIILSKS